MSQLTVSVNSSDHMQGPDHAPASLVEYGDYECPSCGEAYPILKLVRMVMGHELRFVFRNFPLTEQHPHALHAAQAAEAAGLQGKFWEMHDMLYENQNQLEEVDLSEYARGLKLDMDQFRRDFASEPVKTKIE